MNLHLAPILTSLTFVVVLIFMGIGKERDLNLLKDDIVQENRATIDGTEYECKPMSIKTKKQRLLKEIEALEIKEETP